MDRKQQDIVRLVKSAAPKNPLAYMREAAADYLLDVLNNSILHCNACPCSNKYKSIAVGNPRGSIVVISENISTNQILQSSGQTVFSPCENIAGQEFLDSVLDYYCVNRDELLFINSVNCATFKKDSETETRPPKKSEVTACNTFVDYALDIVRPCGILLLGSVAMNVWNIDSITNARGKFIYADRAPAMPTFHPDYFERIAAHKTEEQVDALRIQFINDVGNFFRYLYEKYPDSNLFTADPSAAFAEIS